MFKIDNKFNSSHKMGNAQVGYNDMIAKFGEGETGHDKSANTWQGKFTAADGETMRASAWDWKGGLRAGCGVSVWVSNPDYLYEFVLYLQK